MGSKNDAPHTHIWWFENCLIQEGPGSVRLRFGGGTVRAVPVFGSGGSSAKRGFSELQYSFTGKDGSGCGSWKTVPAVPVPLSVSGKPVPTVPVSSSGSVPEPPCEFLITQQICCTGISGSNCFV